MLTTTVFRSLLDKMFVRVFLHLVTVQSLLQIRVEDLSHRESSLQVATIQVCAAFNVLLSVLSTVKRNPLNIDS